MAKSKRTRKTTSGKKTSVKKTSVKKMIDDPRLGIPTVTIEDPDQDEPIPVGNLPYTARGTTTAAEEEPVTSMTYQIDGGKPQAVNPDAPEDFSNWHFEITEAQCPVREAPYTLVVFARDEANHVGESPERNFTVTEE